MKLKKNIGPMDQILRIGISSFLIYITLIDTTFIADPVSSGLFAFLGVGNLIVALIRFCPLYALVGINTCRLS
ncbi:DUF2892 domain-containing protein [Thiohalobacter sp. IOR34]|uniref:YgaP family membrane protein n=1 Tax=Thiohalobacter sp. IOR34 TaxID=3057176 RepID=UPI0025B1C890|nr:DUF2892 domain-containing protein [Thiohalobacter sp. IOR34]WJW75914.1 DUF2892 domain-containing protein [Thiohalobacter sp. IOR34]